MSTESKKPERITYLNGLHIETTGWIVDLTLEQGEFALEAGVRVHGEIRGGTRDTPGTAVPCDLHEVLFTRKKLLLKRARRDADASRVSVEVLASVDAAYDQIEGEVGNAGGELQLTFGDGRLVARGPGRFPFSLRRQLG